MGNSVKLCLLLATHIRSTGKNTRVPIMYTKLFISYLVIMSTCSGLPLNQEEADELVIKDEAKKIQFEQLRDHDLQLGGNGGQSGGWPFIFSEVQEVIGETRPKRQDVMADDLEVPPVTTTEAIAPIDDAYAQRLKQLTAAAAFANKLANAKPQKIDRGPGGYGRKKRQAKRQADDLEVPPVTTTEAAIDDAYAQRLKQLTAAAALANKLANAKPQKIDRGPGGYGRKKRQVRTRVRTLVNPTLSLPSQRVPSSPRRGSSGYGRKRRQISDAEEEAILQEIIEAEIPSIIMQPKIKSWGETGVVLPKKSA